jgi:lactate dehydrogenase-like 2-hydroxyacid dehydrogenase
VCDVVRLNCPLHPETEHMINDETLKNCKRGAYLVNTARGKLCDCDAIVRAVKSGQLAGLCRRCLVPAAGAQRPSVGGRCLMKA